ncbi:MAG: Type 1 glutamine amidotransferase-like domain-containing protein [Mariniblastus sp.]|nr:Type 1 glutamine amidotransferase-like domain-containing protein [Mariniblastus sp.]
MMCSGAWRKFSIVFVLLMVFAAPSAVGQEAESGQEPQAAARLDESFDVWPVDLKINGQVMMAGSAELPEGTIGFFLDRVRRRSGDAVPKVLQISLGAPATRLEWPDGVEADSIGFESDKPLDLDGVHGLWVTSSGSFDQPLSPLRSKVLQQLADPMREFIDQGGILFADAALSPWLGQMAFQPVDQAGKFPHVANGLNLVPDCLIGCRFEPAHERQMISALTLLPRRVGVGIPAGAIVVLNGRKMRAYGEPGLFYLPANADEPVRRRVLRVGALGQRRINPYRQLLDLTAWRRDAIDRTLAPFPPADPPKPYVENGSLVIVGGGGMPEGLMEKFVELAGGPQAKLVYVPCSEFDEVPVSQRLLDRWLELGAASAVQLHTKDRVQADTDEAFLEPLREATGIWYGGGRQWNFSDSYYGTQAHRLMKQVVERGGVVGGSSAGASIQARYLARANPLGNFDIMVDGYERGGLGFLAGVAIDQHFSQRRRQKDMSSLVDAFPQLLGIGLDEKTALLVKGSTAEVVGEGRAFFYDRNQAVIPDQPDYVALEQGEVYDLEKRIAVPQESTDE